MSIFNIKLKTKSGNDVKKKETFTVFFRLNFKRGVVGKSIAEYTYRIMSSKGVTDTRRVMELKNPKDVKSLEDLTLKVILNFCHMIGGITKAHDINPDFILFMSPDLNGKINKSWQFLKDTFENKAVNWDEGLCSRFKINKDELELLQAFVEINPGCSFRSLDPGMNPIKYEKSIHICNMLQDRIDRTLLSDDLALK